MKKFTLFIVSAFLLALSACQRNAPQEQAASPAGTGSSSDTVSVVQLSKSAKADTLYVDFKILDPEGKKLFVNQLEKGNVTVAESGSGEQDMTPKVDSVIDIRQKKVISDQISMLFLVDRSGSISQEALQKQFDQFAHIMDVLPNTKVYLSFMDSTVTPSLLATKDNLKFKFYEEFTVREGTQKYLYKAIMAKMA